MGSVPLPDATVEKTADAAPRRLTSEALLGTRREVVIVHNGREYRLRLTQNGKLILTA
jgi:hemin uptake protein HemP